MRGEILTLRAKRALIGVGGFVCIDGSSLFAR